MDVKCNAEIKHLNCRKEIHGEQEVPAIDVKLLLLGVPVDRLGSLCPDISKRFYDGPIVAIGEVNPLTVGHKLENLAVKIGEVSLTGADIKKGAKIFLQPNNMADVEVKVQAEHHGHAATKILDMLRTEVMVSISERQLKVAGLEQ